MLPALPTKLHPHLSKFWLKNLRTQWAEMFTTVQMGTFRKIFQMLFGLGDQHSKREKDAAALKRSSARPSETATSAPPIIEPAANDAHHYFEFSKLNPELIGIRERLNSAENAAAFQELNKIKGRAERVENVDYLRAYAFLRKHHLHAAVEALKEELRWFPRNQAARASLEKVSAMLGPAAAVEIGDAEFQEIVRVIRPYTMVGEARLLSLYTLAKDVLKREIPGNFVECGVAAGGASALLAAVIKRHSKVPRKLFSFDTFEGMPPATAEDTHLGQHAENTGWGTGTCSAPIDSLLEAAEKLGASEVIEPIKGLFADTLPPHKTRIGPIAFLHVDGDWYSSTRDVLDNLYDAVSPGGRLQVDDYGYWEGCKKAVTDFQNERGLTFQINVIDDTGVWISK